MTPTVFAMRYTDGIDKIFKKKPKNTDFKLSALFNFTRTLQFNEGFKNSVQSLDQTYVIVIKV